MDHGSGISVVCYRYSRGGTDWKSPRLTPPPDNAIDTLNIDWLEIGLKTVSGGAPEFFDRPWTISDNADQVIRPPLSLSYIVVAMSCRWAWIPAIAFENNA